MRRKEQGTITTVTIMKKTDIRRLEKVVELYGKIEKILDQAYDSIYDNDADSSEFVMPGMSALHFVRDERLSAMRNRKWIENKLKTIKENNNEHTEERVM